MDRLLASPSRSGSWLPRQPVVHDPQTKSRQPAEGHHEKQRQHGQYAARSNFLTGVNKHRSNNKRRQNVHETNDRGSDPLNLGIVREGLYSASFVTRSLRSISGGSVFRCLAHVSLIHSRRLLTMLSVP